MLFLGGFAERRTADSRAILDGNGYHPECVIQTGVGPVSRVGRMRRSAKQLRNELKWRERISGSSLPLSA